MYQTQYLRPANLTEALEALADDEEAMVLAGGQTLVPTLKQRLAAPSLLVDISGLAELQGIRPGAGEIVIGAGVTHFEVATNPDIRRDIPGLALLAGKVGDPAVRYCGTIGGSLANNDPSACYPAAVLALGGTLVTSSREIAADEFFAGLFTTALEPGEILTAIRLPLCPRSAYGKFPNPASRYPMAGVFVAVMADGPRVAVTGAGDDGVFRHEGLEAALASDFSADAVSGAEIGAENLIGDIHADPDYRAALIRAMARQAVAALT